MSKNVCDENSMEKEEYLVIFDKKLEFRKLEFKRAKFIECSFPEFSSIVCEWSFRLSPHFASLYSELEDSMLAYCFPRRMGRKLGVLEILLSMLFECCE
jgi:hypothetical protein